MNHLKMILVNQCILLTVVVIFGVYSLVLAAPQVQKPFYKIEDAEDHFKQFMVKHNKQYETSQEMEKRLQIFKENLKKINKKNMEKHETAIFGINQFADLEHEEFRNTYLCLHMPSTKLPCTQMHKNFSMSFNKALTETFDWRDRNVVTRVKNQGNCGSCWAFAAVGNIESQYAIKHHNLIEFSEQQMLDCDRIGTCKGGFFANGIATIQKQGGIEGESDYPYEIRKNQCRFDPNKAKAKVSGCYTFQFQSEEELKQALFETGPIAIGVDSDDFHIYQGGVLANCKAETVNHAVLLVGYGEDPRDGPYWLIKNSWAETFGERGYIKIKRNVNACNIMRGPFATSEVA